MLTQSDTDFRILVVDDNTAIHSDFKKILSNNVDTDLNTISLKMFGKKIEDVSLPKFEIHTASQGQEGVECIKKALEQGKSYSLAFVDIRMPPGWDGIETIKHIWELDKDIQIVICTAYSDYSWEETVANLGKSDNLLILKKPFDNISVRQLACALTKKWQLLKDSKVYTHQLQLEVADRTLTLEKSLSLIKSTFESSSDGILVISNEGEIIDYNQKLVDLLQIPEMILKTKNKDKVLECIANQITNPEVFKANLEHQERDEIRTDTLLLKNDLILECYSQPHKLNGKIIGRILDFRDITKRARLEEKLQHQATHDPLTGLVNRIELMRQMQIKIDEAKNNHTNVVVIFLDFDRFKLVNDSLSHESGDNLLQIAANRLQAIVNASDTLARLGGDEFILVFSNLDTEKLIVDKIYQLLEVFQEPFVLDHTSIVLTASIGISIFPDNGDSPSMLLRNADAAMYRAKANKGNNYQFYTSEMNKEILAELEQEMELRRALENNEFYLCYQPQIDLMQEKIVAVEALIRWKHPTKGILLPINFIRTAEETGLIIKIGEWVIRKACEQIISWINSGFSPIRIAVNVTAEQLKQQNLSAVIKNILEEFKLDPKYLELELTENVIISNPEIIRTVSELKKLGISIAIDDFGTGYSCLSYLHKIPLDRLKIDRSLIQQIQQPSDDEAIIRAVIAMAKSLNLEVLAEGVETTDQLQFLKKYECGDVQGFYFGQPLNTEELEDVLKHPFDINKIMKKANR